MLLSISKFSFCISEQVIFFPPKYQTSSKGIEKLIRCSRHHAYRAVITSLCFKLAGLNLHKADNCPLHCPGSILSLLPSAGLRALRVAPASLAARNSPVTKVLATGACAEATCEIFRSYI